MLQFFWLDSFRIWIILSSNLVTSDLTLIFQTTYGLNFRIGMDKRVFWFVVLRMNSKSNDSVQFSATVMFSSVFFIQFFFAVFLFLVRNLVLISQFFCCFRINEAHENELRCKLLTEGYLIDLLISQCLDLHLCGAVWNCEKKTLILSFF
jgi:hypothetical protein